MRHVGETSYTPFLPIFYQGEQLSRLPFAFLDDVSLLKLGQI